MECGDAAPINIVLIGGGHAHVEVLRAFGMRPIAGARVTLVAKELLAPYSGMLAGWIAGRYKPEEAMIDLRRLAAFAGARVVHGSAEGIDPDQRMVFIEGRPALPYDILSIDVGIVPDVSQIAGAEEHALLVKPISSFNRRWSELRERHAENGIRNAVVIGGGPAAFELANGLRHRLDRDAAGRTRSGSVTIAGGCRWLASAPAYGRRMARRALAEMRVDLIEERAAAVTSDHVLLMNGKHLPADVVLVATGAKAPAWLRRTGLSLSQEGFLLVGRTLQSSSRPEIFAAGDCVHLLDQPRPKAGVFAVREGPVLADNIRRSAASRPLRNYNAQRHALQILSLASGDAIAFYGPLALRSRHAQTLKTWLDRRFVRRFGAGLPRAGWLEDAPGTEHYRG